MTADDVGQSILDTGRNPKSQFRELANDVSGYKVVSPDTIDVAFSKPDPVFPLHCEGIPVMPEALIKKEGREAFAKHPIGTGPYKFVSWLADDHLVLTAWERLLGHQAAFANVRLESIPNVGDPAGFVAVGPDPGRRKDRSVGLPAGEEQRQSLHQPDTGPAHDVSRAGLLARDRLAGAGGRHEESLPRSARARGGAAGDQRAGDQEQDLQRRGRDCRPVHAARGRGVRCVVEAAAVRASRARRSCWPRPVIRTASRCASTARTTAICKTAWSSRRSAACWDRPASRCTSIRCRRRCSSPR